MPTPSPVLGQEPEDTLHPLQAGLSAYFCPPSCVAGGKPPDRLSLSVSPIKWAYESQPVAGKPPPQEFSAQGKQAGGPTPQRGSEVSSCSAHLVGLYGPRLHVQVPDFDREVISGEHVPATVAELHIRHRGNDF